MEVFSERQQRILNDLTAEIGNQARSCAREQIDPQRGSDDMDAYIEERQQNVAKLRKMREELENLFTGIVA